MRRGFLDVPQVLGRQPRQTSSDGNASTMMADSATRPARILEMTGEPSHRGNASAMVTNAAAKTDNFIGTADEASARARPNGSDLLAGLRPRLADFEMINMGVRERTLTGMILYQRLQRDMCGRIVTTDIAPGGLLEVAQRLQFLANSGFKEFVAILIDRAYDESQIGWRHFPAGDGPPALEASAGGAASILATFFGNLRAWTAAQGVRCSVYVGSSAASVVSLTKQGELPPSHIVVANGDEAKDDAGIIAASAHPEGFMELHSEWMSTHDMCGRYVRRLQSQ